MSDEILKARIIRRLDRLSLHYQKNPANMYKQLELIYFCLEMRFLDLVTDEFFSEFVKRVAPEHWHDFCVLSDNKNNSK